MSIARLLGRRPELPFAEWGWQVRQFDLPREGRVEFAQWRHPATSVTPMEQAEVDGLRHWIAPGDFAIDVGAHTGDTSVPMALAAGPTGCVLALEPNRYAFAVLAANAALNRDKTHIAPRCLAAAESDGPLEFLYGDASYCNGGAPIGLWNPLRRKFPLPVQGRRLIAVLEEQFADRLPRLSYVKVDAEGHDLAILRSILPVLREYRPVVRTEVFKKLSGAQRYGLFDLLSGAGYEVFAYVGGAQPQGAALARRDMTRRRHFDLLATPAAAAGALRRAA